MYKIVGVDGKIYGPVSSGQIRQWIAEGRANAHTQALPEGAMAWQTLGALPEFAAHFAAPVPPAIPPLTGAPPRKNRSYAIAGMILGIASWILCCCYSLPWSILGIVFSTAALVQINRHPDIHEGRAFAVSGLILSITALVFYGVMLVIALATGNFHVHSNWHFQ